MSAPKKIDLAEMVPDSSSHFGLEGRNLPPTNFGRVSVQTHSHCKANGISTEQVAVNLVSDAEEKLGLHVQRECFDGVRSRLGVI